MNLNKREDDMRKDLTFKEWLRMLKNDYNLDYNKDKIIDFIVKFDDFFKITNNIDLPNSNEDNKNPNEIEDLKKQWINKIFNITNVNTHFLKLTMNDLKVDFIKLKNDQFYNERYIKCFIEYLGKKMNEEKIEFLNCLDFIIQNYEIQIFSDILNKLFGKKIIIKIIDFLNSILNNFNNNELRVNLIKCIIEKLKLRNKAIIILIKLNMICFKDEFSGKEIITYYFNNYFFKIKESTLIKEIKKIKINYQMKYYLKLSELYDYLEIYCIISLLKLSDDSFELNNKIKYIETFYNLLEKEKDYVNGIISNYSTFAKLLIIIEYYIQVHGLSIRLTVKCDLNSNITDNYYKILKDLFNLNEISSYFFMLINTELLFLDLNLDNLFEKLFNNLENNDYNYLLEIYLLKLKKNKINYWNLFKKKQMLKSIIEKSILYIPILNPILYNLLNMFKKNKNNLRKICNELFEATQICGNDTDQDLLIKEFNNLNSKTENLKEIKLNIYYGNINYWNFLYKKINYIIDTSNNLDNSSLILDINFICNIGSSFIDSFEMSKFLINVTNINNNIPLFIFLMKILFYLVSLREDNVDTINWVLNIIYKLLISSEGNNLILIFKIFDKNYYNQNKTYILNYLIENYIIKQTFDDINNFKMLNKLLKIMVLLIYKNNWSIPSKDEVIEINHNISNYLQILTEDFNTNYSQITNLINNTNNEEYEINKDYYCVYEFLNNYFCKLKDYLKDDLIEQIDNEFMNTIYKNKNKINLILEYLLNLFNINYKKYKKEDIDELSNNIIVKFCKNIIDNFDIINYIMINLEYDLKNSNSFENIKLLWLEKLEISPDENYAIFHFLKGILNLLFKVLQIYRLNSQKDKHDISNNDITLKLIKDLQLFIFKEKMKIKSLNNKHYINWIILLFYFQNFPENLNYKFLKDDFLVIKYDELNENIIYLDHNIYFTNFLDIFNIPCDIKIKKSINNISILCLIELIKIIKKSNSTENDFTSFILYNNNLNNKSKIEELIFNSMINELKIIKNITTKSILYIRLFFNILKYQPIYFSKILDIFEKNNKNLNINTLFSFLINIINNKEKDDNEYFYWYKYELINFGYEILNSNIIDIYLKNEFKQNSLPILIEINMKTIKVISDLSIILDNIEVDSNISSNKIFSYNDFLRSNIDILNQYNSFTMAMKLFKLLTKLFNILENDFLNTLNCDENNIIIFDPFYKDFNLIKMLDGNESKYIQYLFVYLNLILERIIFFSNEIFDNNMEFIIFKKLKLFNNIEINLNKAINIDLLRSFDRGNNSQLKFTFYILIIKNNFNNTFYNTFNKYLISLSNAYKTLFNLGIYGSPLDYLNEVSLSSNQKNKLTEKVKYFIYSGDNLLDPIYNYKINFNILDIENDSYKNIPIFSGLKKILSFISNFLNGLKPTCDYFTTVNNAIFNLAHNNFVILKTLLILLNHIWSSTQISSNDKILGSIQDVLLELLCNLNDITYRYQRFYQYENKNIENINLFLNVILLILKNLNKIKWYYNESYKTIKLNFIEKYLLELLEKNQNYFSCLRIIDELSSLINYKINDKILFLIVDKLNNNLIFEKKRKNNIDITNDEYREVLLFLINNTNKFNKNHFDLNLTVNVLSNLYNIKTFNKENFNNINIYGDKKKNEKNTLWVLLLRWVANICVILPQDSNYSNKIMLFIQSYKHRITMILAKNTNILDCSANENNLIFYSLGYLEELDLVSILINHIFIRKNDIYRNHNIFFEDTNKLILLKTLSLYNNFENKNRFKFNAITTYEKHMELINTKDNSRLEIPKLSVNKPSVYKSSIISSFSGIENLFNLKIEIYNIHIITNLLQSVSYKDNNFSNSQEKTYNDFNNIEVILNNWFEIWELFFEIFKKYNMKPNELNQLLKILSISHKSEHLSKLNNYIPFTYYNMTKDEFIEKYLIFFFYLKLTIFRNIIDLKQHKDDMNIEKLYNNSKDKWIMNFNEYKNLSKTKINDDIEIIRKNIMRFEDLFKELN